MLSARPFLMGRSISMEKLESIEELISSAFSPPSVRSERVLQGTGLEASRLG